VHMWTAHVVTPAFAEPRGIRRLWALHERRIEFYASGVLPGGCFFVATQAEFDDRPGPVRDALAAAINDWLFLIKTVAAQAVELGELRPDTDVELAAVLLSAPNTMTSLGFSPHLDKEQLAERTVDMVLQGIRA